MGTKSTTLGTYIEDDYSKYNTATNNKAFNVFGKGTGNLLGGYSNGGYIPAPQYTSTPTGSGTLLSLNSGNITGSPLFGNLGIDTSAGLGNLDFTGVDPAGLNTEQLAGLTYLQDLNKKVGYENSLIGQTQPYIQGFANIAGGLGSLANIYTGFKQLGLMEDQVDIAKDQWATTKEELNRVKGVRDKLNASYAA